MPITSSSISIAPRCITRRSNGRRRAAPVPAALPGNISRILPGGCASRSIGTDLQIGAANDKKPGFDRAFCRVLETHNLFKERHWVDRSRILADFEVQLRLADVAAHARRSKGLAALDLLPPGDAESIRMAVDRDRTVVMANENRVAEFLQAVAGIDDDAVLGSLDRRTLGNRDVDTVVAAAIDVGAIAGDDGAADRPAIFADAGRLGRIRLRIGLGGIVDRLARRSGGNLLRLCGIGRRVRTSSNFRRLLCNGFRHRRHARLDRDLLRFDGSRLDGIGGSDRAMRQGQRLADANAVAGLHAVRPLKLGNRHAAFLGNSCQRIAWLDDIAACTLRAWTLAVAGGELVRIGKASLRFAAHLIAGRERESVLLLRRLCRPGHLAALGKIGRFRGHLGGACGTCAIHGRNDDLLTGLGTSAIAQAVGAEDFLFRNTVAARQQRDVLTLMQRHARSIDRGPARRHLRRRSGCLDRARRQGIGGESRSIARTIIVARCGERLCQSFIFRPGDGPRTSSLGRCAGGRKFGALDRDRCRGCPSAGIGRIIASRRVRVGLRYRCALLRIILLAVSACLGNVGARHRISIRTIKTAPVDRTGRHIVRFAEEPAETGRV
ncbi:hypothetical protein RHSP_14185 [Rhizobium freirei PRF 81]|uniref:Uncharacterized protein n=1 Tax=Rhizobium freirei PRF 81 TaxID=363754 RepID=N6U9T0_9HYPH|nr:hypothetical protein RHSP_14185 [Rhizobium freirei PRF 81]